MIAHVLITSYLSCDQTSERVASDSEGSLSPSIFAKHVSMMSPDSTERFEYKTRIRYPDPFQPCGLELELTEPSVVSIRIADDKGNELATLVNEEAYPAGKHSIDLDVSQYGPGNYFYRMTLQYGENILVETRKLVFGK